MQGTTRGSDEAIQTRAVKERADLADATRTLELESAKGSQNDTSEDRLTTAGAEEQVNGVAIVRGVMAGPVVEGSVGDAEALGSCTLGRMIGVGEVLKGSGDLGASPAERVLARGLCGSRLSGRHGSFPWVDSWQSHF